MIQFRARTPRWIIIVIDLLIAAVSLMLSYLIRFDLNTEFSIIKTEWEVLSKSILVYFLIKFLVFYALKIHKGLVRYTSTQDLRRILLASIIASLIFLILSLIRKKFLDDYYLFPMSILIMEFIFSLSFIVGSRFVIKLLYLESIKSKQTKENVLIYGAGTMGMITKRTIENDTRNNQVVLGFIDGNEKLVGNRIDGQQIYSPEKIIELQKQLSITSLIISIRNPAADQLKKVIENCFEAGIKVQKVPDPKTWVNGELSALQIVKIPIEDLLGRAPIALNQEKMQVNLSDKIILVTGAAGSIGSGLVLELLRYNPKKIILLDQAESPLYDLENHLRQIESKTQLEFVIGDICSLERMQKLFETFFPQIIFHAAAYKHVPMMENNPSEAIQTNILGTKHLVDLACLHNVQKFIFISTDKAVNPTNVMGASKRIAEMYAQQKNKLGATKFITTRFGNVLGSNGSVIPLFQKQIENGGPVTVTDERVTRFFMTIPEACQLVLEAFAMGEGGEIFVFDMGESIKIIDLAKKMVQLSGLELDKDISIKIIGLRPGEKLYEELLADDENTMPTHHPKILIAKTRDNSSKLSQEIDALTALFVQQDNKEIVRKMKEIVPEFISQNSTFEKLD
ncbi:MAG: nucleoside-diphosphate sugar epimerase/dehydratase [Flavobacteriia bacterium]|nr:nucleoside-diphosphate sugar epimerase/dehydratase [Flavobacteriia bacterium]